MERVPKKVFKAALKALKFKKDNYPQKGLDRYYYGSVLVAERRSDRSGSVYLVHPEFKKS